MIQPPEKVTKKESSLKYCSMRIGLTVQQKGITTYNQVAESLLVEGLQSDNPKRAQTVFSSFFFLSCLSFFSFLFLQPEKILSF